MCRALEYGKTTKAADIVKHLCSRENYDQKLVSETSYMDWSRDSRKDDYYINKEGMYELVFGSQQPKGKNFRKHCCTVMFLRIRQQLTNKMIEDHQQAITGCDNQTQALEFTNDAHQQQLLRLNEDINDLITNRHVACRGGFDNVLCFIKKNSGEVYPYYVI